MHEQVVCHISPQARVLEKSAKLFVMLVGCHQ
jgi:hypothetical protein